MFSVETVNAVVSTVASASVEGDVLVVLPAVPLFVAVGVVEKWILAEAVVCDTIGGPLHGVADGGGGDETLESATRPALYCSMPALSLVLQ